MVVQDGTPYRAQSGFELWMWVGRQCTKCNKSVKDESGRRTCSLGLVERALNEGVIPHWRYQDGIPICSAREVS